MAPRTKAEKEKNQNIQVAVRCRPLNSSERKGGSHNVVEISDDNHEICVKERGLPAAPTKKFAFDKVFGPNTKQMEVYRTMVQPTIEEVLLGYNCTIFAYGQTGTGKTFTMEGESSNKADISWEDDPLTGIIPRAMHHLFSKLERQECEYSVRVSFLEIYNEELIDLLGADAVDNPRLKIYEDVTRKGSCVIQGLEEVVVRSKSEVYDILQTGTAKRQTAATLMNAHSSRSHSLFMVTIHIKENSVDGEELLKTGKLNLVDLAGSECVGRSGAVDKRAREAGNINQSLLTLGRVITSLVEHAPHVPYRESKLTRLLQDSLGGRTKTSIIATISPASANWDETLSTLDYACRAKNITNRPEVNQKLTKKALLKEYTEEIERLRRDLQATRDKNGIFLAQENYDGMQSTIIQQKDAIKEMEDKITALKEEMFKLNDMFSSTKQELVETQEELESTSKTLQVTEVNLQDTKMNLQHTRQDRDEQKYLLSEHVSTEAVLHSKASQLLHTSKEASGDVAGLHEKLDRKKKVEKQNERVEETFKEGFQTNIESMQQSIQTFREEQLTAQCSLCVDMADLVNRRSNEVEKASQSLSSLANLVVAQLEDAKYTQGRHTQNALRHMSKLNDLVETGQDEDTCRQFDFHQEKFVTAMVSVQSILDGVGADLKQLTALLVAKVDSQRQQILNFSENQLSSLGELDKMLSTTNQTQQARLDDHVQCTSNLLTSQTALNQTVSEELLSGIAKLVQDMVIKQDKHMEGNVDQLTCKMAQAKEEMETQTDQTLKIKDRLCKEVEKASTEINEGSHQTLQSAKKEIEKVENGLEKLSAQKQKLEEQVSDFNMEAQKLRKDHTLQVVTLAQEHSQSLEASLEEYITNSKKLTADHSEQVEQLESQQTSEHTQLKTCVQSQSAAVENMSEQLKSFTGDLVDDVKKRNEEVQKLFSDELTKDIPTGRTPQRRDFTFPRVLDKTGRHSILLQDFRSTYVLEEALNTPLLEDSFTGLSEVSQAPTDVAVISDVLPDQTEDPNTSSDSAISTLSIISTASESSQLDCEGKENSQLRPPKPISSRSRAKNQSNSKNSTPSKLKPTPNKSISVKTPNTNSKAKTKLPLRSSNN